MIEVFMSYIRRTWLNKAAACVLTMATNIIVYNYGGAAVPFFWWMLIILLFIDNKSWFK